MGATHAIEEYAGPLEEHGVTQGMDGRGRRRDDATMGRFWRALEQECACISEYPAYAELGGRSRGSSKGTTTRGCTVSINAWSALVFRSQRSA